MLDQSYSAENFRIILDQENRKGIYLEGSYFPRVVEIAKEIKQCNEEIRKNLKIINETELIKLNEKKKKLVQKKEDLLLSELQKVSEKVVDKSFDIELDEINIPESKPVYIVKDLPEHFFALKQIQRNVSKLFSVKQANRSDIVRQVMILLGDKFPKFILRTDIEQFYESIPHKPLLIKINGNNLLSPYSRKILRRLLDKYKDKSGRNKGLPRGIGVSAYLAELYMKDIDKDIRSLKGVTYYARYVDDIIIIFTPTPFDHDRAYIDEVRNIVEAKHHLKLNEDKTNPFDLRNSNQNNELSYLGYKMSFGAGNTKTSLTKHKVDKYLKRIQLAFKSYTNLSKINEKKARKLLVKRIRFLTGNTRLTNNKKNILTGVYYSNRELTEEVDLNKLDEYLATTIKDKISSSNLQNRLERYSFKKGFREKRFSPFKTQELSEIMEVWNRGY